MHSGSLESRVLLGDLHGGRSHEARFNGVWLDPGCSGVGGTGLADTGWTVRLGGCSWPGSEMFSLFSCKVTTQCKLESVDLRTATLRGVTFVDCLCPRDAGPQRHGADGWRLGTALEGRAQRFQQGADGQVPICGARPAGDRRRLLDALGGFSPSAAVG